MIKVYVIFAVFHGHQTMNVKIRSKSDNSKVHKVLKDVVLVVVNVATMDAKIPAQIVEIVIVDLVENAV